MPKKKQQAEAYVEEVHARDTGMSVGVYPATKNYGDMGRAVAVRFTFSDGKFAQAVLDEQQARDVSQAILDALTAELPEPVKH